MAQPYPIVGIEGTGVQPRLEIRDLQKIPIQFSLFIRALGRIHEMRNSDEHSPDYLNKPNSWWQISAIHGLPYVPWSGDPNGQQIPDPKSEWQGYCYHGSALFPTWHRVVMLLVEQSVVKEAIEIASKLEENDSAAKNEKWVETAKKLRFPFWDWTKPETANEGIPKIFQDSTIQIVNPGGSYGPPIHNPLNHYLYAANPGVAQGVEYMGNWKRTYRWVDDGENPTKEQYNLALKAFSEGTILHLYGQDIQLQPVHWLRGKVAGLFHYPLTLPEPSYGPNLWGYFSNTGAKSAGVYAPVQILLPSVEESHNMVHLDTGGNGSMSVNEYAAFDPIFYLHHCNVDRLYAFWEYVYPEYWIENGWKNQAGAIIPFTNDENGNFQQDPNTPVNHATPLIPFRNAVSNYWTSDNTRTLLDTNPTKKYYTYPAIKDPKTGVVVKVDVPYNTKDISLRGDFQQALLNEWSPDLHKTLKTVQTLSKNLHPQHRSLLLQEHEASGISHLRNFVIIGELPEFAFSGSYRLELYLLPKDRQQTTVHVINSISVLSRANPEKCAACKDRRAAGNSIRGYMPLDPRVILYLISQLDYTQLPVLTDLDKLSIVVKESFGTRLVKSDGTILAVADASIGTKPDEALEEAKAPELTLYSHLISFEPVTRRGTVSPVVKFEESVHHGLFGEKSGWKVY